MSERRIDEETSYTATPETVDDTPVGGGGAAFHIAAVAGAVAAVMAAQFPTRVWLTADVVAVRHRGPIVFGELRSGDQTMPFVARRPGHELVAALRVGVAAVWDVAVEYWAPSSTIQLVLYGISAGSAAVGEAAQRLEAVRERIRPLIGVNAARRLAGPPRRVAVVAGDGTEGLADFRSAFDPRTDMVVVPAPVSGETAAAPVADGIAKAGKLSGVDVVAVARGGGAKSDMVWANSEQVCRAVADCPVPVWVGVGHLGDRHLLDEVAARAFSTPAECGAETARLWQTQDRAGAERTLRQGQAMADRARQQAEAETVRHRRRVRALTALFLLVVAAVLVWWLAGGTP